MKGEKMNSAQRRDKIITILKDSNQAISASALAEQLLVSRQIIVGDIALLRAKGLDILSTPKGYMFNSMLKSEETIFKIACLHDDDLTQKEIYTIVDNGGKLIDVIVEHPLYGQLIGQLNIYSRYDADDFFYKVEQQQASLLSKLTSGIHLHTISCKDEETSCRIKAALHQLGIMLSNE